jgi:perosamine synthetase
MRIPLARPDLTEVDVEAVTGVLRTPWLSLGSQLTDFERSIARFVGSSHCVAVNSGTSGLHLCLRSLRVGAGDEVIVPSFTFIATANAVRYVGATPVFVDIEPDGLGLDPSKIEMAITSRTKAIVVVHTFGRPANLSEILQIAKRRNLFVVEDACEALGAEYEGKKVGPLGDVGVFAFYPNKQITTGEGGAIVTHNPEIARVSRAMCNQGRAGSSEWFDHFELGYSYRLSEINSALGNAQLKRIESMLAKREEIAGLYFERLRGRTDLRLPSPAVPNCRISWFVYVVRLAPQFNLTHRDWIRNEMMARGIGCGRYFAPVHLQPIYQHEMCIKHDLSVTEATAERCLALPFFNTISEKQIDEVCEVLLELLHRVDRSASLVARKGPK